MHNKKLKVFVRTLCAFSTLVYFLCSTARIRQDISAAWFYSCKLFWRNDECVLLPYFNARPDIFALMNCCVVRWFYFPPIS